MNWARLWLLLVIACWVFVAVSWWPTIRDRWSCWRAPPVVEFHQGMMLCPGQSATMTIIVPGLPWPVELAPEPKGDGI